MAKTSAKTPTIKVDLAEALDRLSHGVTITDERGVILYYSRVQSEIDGYEPGEVLGRRISDIYVPFPDNSPSTTVMNTGQPIYDLFEIYETRHGRVVNTSHTILPLTEGGRVTGSLCLIKPLESAKADCRDQDARGSVLFENLIGSSPAFRDAINAALSAADTPSSVLIYGETGSGKEMLARQLHERSRRADKAYVTINCSAIPATLLEGLLFGSVKGAFTGARNSPGLFEEAHGGTIYLDEVDSMPLELQPKLLRVIQERKVRRVGAVRETPVNLKIISSFSGDPLEAVQAGRVRADLFYRLGVVIINIPPLRERVSDLPGLVSFFINKHKGFMNKEVRGLSPEVMAVFKVYPWPGNVRELENVIEAGLNMIADGGVIEPEHLPLYLRRPPEDFTGRRLSEAAPPASTVPASAANQARARTGRREIVEALTRSRGSLKEAAAALGLSRQLLAYRLRKYGLTRQQFDD